MLFFTKNGHMKRRIKDIKVTFSGPNCVQGRCCLTLSRAGREGARDALCSLLSERNQEVAKQRSDAIGWIRKQRSSGATPLAGSGSSGAAEQRHWLPPTHVADQCVEGRTFTNISSGQTSHLKGSTRGMRMFLIFAKHRF